MHPFQSLWQTAKTSSPRKTTGNTLDKDLNTFG